MLVEGDAAGVALKVTGSLHVGEEEGEERGENQGQISGTKGTAGKLKSQELLAKVKKQESLKTKPKKHRE